MMCLPAAACGHPKSQRAFGFKWFDEDEDKDDEPPRACFFVLIKTLLDGCASETTMTRPALEASASSCLIINMDFPRVF